MRRAGLSGACTCQRTLSAVIVAVLVISSCILLPVIPEPAGAAFSPPRTPNLFLQREGAKKKKKKGKRKKEGGGRESEGGTLLQRARARERLESAKRNKFIAVASLLGCGAAAAGARARAVFLALGVVSSAQTFGKVLA